MAWSAFCFPREDEYSTGDLTVLNGLGSLNCRYIRSLG